MVGHFQLYNNSIFRIFITVVTVVTVATVKFPLSYCRDSNLEDSSTKSTKYIGFVLGSHAFNPFFG